ncbi:peptidoglycan-binding protein [bacterium]|nr:MAG: peptidoglycan-binding protein [bacterium]
MKLQLRGVMGNLFRWVLLGFALFACAGPGGAQTNLTKAPLKWNSIRRGHQGTLFPRTIEALQYLLRARGVYSGKPNGVFDAKMVGAIKAFQKKNGLIVDGILGSQTLPKLVPILRKGAKGDAVRAAQILVLHVTDHIGGQPNEGLLVDGVFGAKTQEAVKTAQECLNFPEERLTANGIMDRRTWCILLDGDVIIP